jgi:hypothetical protein
MNLAKDYNLISVLMVIFGVCLHAHYLHQCTVLCSLLASLVSISILILTKLTTRCRRRHWTLFVYVICNRGLKVYCTFSVQITSVLTSKSKTILGLAAIFTSIAIFFYISGVRRHSDEGWYEETSQLVGQRPGHRDQRAHDDQVDRKTDRDKCISQWSEIYEDNQ